MNEGHNTNGTLGPQTTTAKRLIAPIELRKALLKIMPGYAWTVHIPTWRDDILTATGVQTSGFNRTSTLVVEVHKRGDDIEYAVKSSGFGLRAPWLCAATGRTLAQALRSLQNDYEGKASNYAAHARSLQAGRARKK